MKTLKIHHLNGLYVHWTGKYPELPPMLYVQQGGDYGNASLSFHLDGNSGAILRALADAADSLWAEKLADDEQRAGQAAPASVK